MEIVDAVNFGITLGLGFLSLGVSILSIILSIYYAKQSNDAFDKINNLTNEIKLLASETCNNQQKYSDKMLDSIIEQSKYGINEKNGNKTSDETLRIITKEIRDDLEDQINDKLDKATKTLNISTKIRSGITKSIKETDINFENIKQKFELPNSIKEKLESLRSYPAHYILLRAIIISGVKTFEELTNCENDYLIPQGWNGRPIERLIDVGLLERTENGFKIPDGLIIPYQYWIERNKSAFQKILDSYKNKKVNKVTELEKEISENEIVF